MDILGWQRNGKRLPLSKRTTRRILHLITLTPTSVGSPYGPNGGAVAPQTWPGCADMKPYGSVAGYAMSFSIPLVPTSVSVVALPRPMITCSSDALLPPKHGTHYLVSSPGLGLPGPRRSPPSPPHCSPDSMVTLESPVSPPSAREVTNALSGELLRAIWLARNHEAFQGIPVTYKQIIQRFSRSVLLLITAILSNFQKDPESLPSFMDSWGGFLLLS
ncbi:MAG: hypothetical protein DHS80DRAFT_28785 [Piptocephalis tieghemiana]|nr:MAG: hypothetical protein DHS80DRAFT_28785 [Piptocephalis tieghemiana]